MNSVSTLPATNSGWEARSMRKSTLVDNPRYGGISCELNQMDQMKISRMTCNVELCKAGTQLEQGREAVRSPNNQLSNHGVVVHRHLPDKSPCDSESQTGTKFNHTWSLCLTPVSILTSAAGAGVAKYSNGPIKRFENGQTAWCRQNYLPQA